MGTFASSRRWIKANEGDTVSKPLTKAVVRTDAISAVRMDRPSNSMIDDWWTMLSV